MATTGYCCSPHSLELCQSSHVVHKECDRLGRQQLEALLRGGKVSASVPQQAQAYAYADTSVSCQSWKIIAVVDEMVGEWELGSLVWWEAGSEERRGLVGQGTVGTQSTEGPA